MKLSLLAMFLGILVSVSALAAPKSVTVHVNGMVCQMCSQGITKKFKANESVENVHVDMDKKQVHLTFKEGKDMTDADITEGIRDAGVAVDRIVR